MAKPLYQQYQVNKQRIGKLNEIIQEINAVLITLDRDAENLDAAAARIAEEEFETEKELALLANLPQVIATYLIGPTRQPDEFIQPHYEPAAAEDTLILTITPQTDGGDIARRKLTIVGPKSTKTIDNRTTFSSANFTKETLKAIFDDMRTERDIKRNLG